MTAVQILEKLGANASFNPINLSEDEIKSVEKVLQNVESMPVLSHHTPDVPDDEDDEDTEEKE